MTRQPLNGTGVALTDAEFRRMLALNKRACACGFWISRTNDTAHPFDVLHKRSRATVYQASSLDAIEDWLNA